MSTLSVCLFVDTDLVPIARALAPLRSVADEIVVAVDERFDGSLDPLDGIADVVERRPFVWPLEANLEALYDTCSSEWVLRLDGDEVPSAALVDELGGWEWSRNITHALVPRRWIAPDGRGWIEANPWWPDPQLRLLRRGADLGGGERRVHWSPEIDGSSRMLSGPIYHLDHIWAPLERREAKARTYERNLPRSRTHGGASMSLYYLPEHATRSDAIAPVPEADRALLESVMGLDLPLAPPTAVKSEPAAVAVGRRLDGLVRVDHIDRVLPAGFEAEVMLSVASTGSAPLRSGGGTDSVLLGAQWHAPGVEDVDSEARSELSVPIEPGERQSVRLVLPVPGVEGEWDLSIGLVEEGVQWLARAESLRVESRCRPRIQIVGGISPHRHLGDDLVVDMLIESLTVAAPEAQIVVTGDAPDVLAARFGVGVVPSAGPVVHRGPGGGSRREVAERVRRARESVERHLASGEALAPELGALVQSLRLADVLVLATAGSLSSRYAVAALWPRVLEVAIAELLGLPVVVAGAGLGPFDRFDRTAIRALLASAHHVDVRDERSAAFVSRARGQPVEAVPDIAGVAIVGEPVSDSSDLVVSVRARESDRTIARMARAIDADIGVSGAKVVFLPQEEGPGGGDGVAVAKLERHGVEVAEIADLARGPEVIASARAAIGSRFHLGVLAAAAGVPSAVFTTDEYDRRRAAGLSESSGGSVMVCSTRTRPTSIAEHLQSGRWPPSRPAFPLSVSSDVIAPLLRVRGW